MKLQRLLITAIVAWPALAQAPAPSPVSPPSTSLIPRDRCDERKTDDSFLYQDKPVEKERQHLRPPRTFAETAKIVCDQEGASGPFRLIESQKEYGSRDGLDYRLYYSSGSGAVVTAGNAQRILDGKLWDLVCKVDTMDDSKRCYLFRDSLYVYYEGPGKWSVRVGHSHITKSEIAIRLNEGPAIRGVAPEFTGPASKQIVEGLKTPGRVRTRYLEFPSRVHEDEFDNQGFALAAELMEWSYQNLAP